MSKIQNKVIKNNVNPLVLRRDQAIIELNGFLRSISDYEQSNIFLKKLIELSRKRHKKSINKMIKKKY